MRLRIERSNEQTQSKGQGGKRTERSQARRTSAAAKRRSVHERVSPAVRDIAMKAQARVCAR
jgi:hypothetical protein